MSKLEFVRHLTTVETSPTPTSLWRAVDGKGEKVILKSANDTNGQRFLENAFRIFETHPDLPADNIQKILKIEHQDNQTRALLNYLEGQPTNLLTQSLFANEEISSVEKIKIINQFFQSLCKIVTILHNHNLVHCDIKPNNTLFELGDKEHSKVKAKLIDPTYITKTDQAHYPNDPDRFAGTYVFIPPEICFGTGTYTNKPKNNIYPSFDIYSLAVTYLCLVERSLIPYQLYILKPPYNIYQKDEITRMANQKTLSSMLVKPSPIAMFRL